MTTRNNVKLVKGVKGFEGNIKVSVTTMNYYDMC